MKKSSAPAPSPAVFKCIPLGAKLTRAACGTRHENARRPWEPGTRRVKVWSEVCAKCEIGAAHERGQSPTKWADGTPVEAAQLLPVQAIVRQRPLKRKERLAALRDI